MSYAYMSCYTMELVKRASDILYTYSSCFTPIGIHTNKYRQKQIQYLI